jgi:hypothetical protein
VVDLGVHRHREIHDRFRRAEHGTQSQLLRKDQCDPVDRRARQGCPQPGGDDPDLRLLQVLTAEGEGRDEQ